MWGFASTIECESSVPRIESVCSKQTITWNLMLSVYSTITLLYTCLKDNNTTNLVRGFELDLYGSEQTRQWTLRFHTCRWIPWPPECWTILQESSWWRQLSSYTCRNFRCEPAVWEARGSAVGWGTALQAGRSRVRFPIESTFQLCNA